MSSSLSKLKFLLDENVRIELFKFLKEEGYDVKLSPKGARDSEVALLSQKEKRILVTNDSDFANPEFYTKDDLFSVVWLQILQSDSKLLISSFKRLLYKYSQKYEGNLIILQDNFWEVYDLGIEIKKIQPQ